MLKKNNSRKFLLAALVVFFLAAGARAQDTFLQGNIIPASCSDTGSFFYLNNDTGRKLKGYYKCNGAIYVPWSFGGLLPGGDGVNALDSNATSLFIKAFYQGALDRQPTALELSTDLAALTTACNGSTGNGAFRRAVENYTTGIVASAEYVARLRTDAEFVGDLYLAYLNRTGDIVGLAFWEGVLAGTTRASLSQTFANSLEHLNNRVAPLCYSALYSADAIALQGIQMNGLAAPTNGQVWAYNSTNARYELVANGSGGTITTTGSPANGNLTKFSGATSITNGNLSGDVTTTDTLAATLANTAVTPGSYTIPSITVDGKGRLTSAANGALTGDVTTSGLAATLANTAVSPGSYTSANITVDSKGRLTSAASGSAGAPGGSDTQVQYNCTSAFCGSPAFIWNNTTKTLTFANESSVQPIINLSTDGMIKSGGGTTATFGGHASANPGFTFNRDYGVSWTNSTSSDAGSVDLNIGRADVKLGTVRQSKNNGGAQAFLMTASNARVTASFNKASNTTLGDVTGVTIPVVTVNVGGSFSGIYTFTFEADFDADATGGTKWAVAKSGSVSAVSYSVRELCYATGAYTANTSRQTTSGTATPGQAGCTAGHITITGSLSADNNGNLTVQFAQSVGVGTSTVLANGSAFNAYPVMN